MKVYEEIKKAHDLVVRCDKIDFAHKLEAHGAIDRIEAAYKAEMESANSLRRHEAACPEDADPCKVREYPRNEKVNDVLLEMIGPVKAHRSDWALLREYAARFKAEQARELIEMETFVRRRKLCGNVEDMNCERLGHELLKFIDRLLDTTCVEAKNEGVAKMTLQEKVETAKKFYEDKYGKDSWQWNDEGIVYAIQDYLSSFELTPEDTSWAKKDETVWYLVRELAKEEPEADACNVDDCERRSLGAEPCPGCKFCDEEGNL